MPARLRFSKYSACGNDFVMVDNRDDAWTSRMDAQLISRLCHRRFGIGADGVILLCTSQTSSIRMRYFNADGSEGEMCGNGIRSLMMFARQLGVVSDHCTCETKERRLELWHSNGRVTVDMGQVISYDWRASVGVDEQQYVGAWLNTGVPHYTLFVPKVDQVQVESLGSKLRHHIAFKSSNGVNVNFIETISPTEIRIRTYERGVEAETLACGTGACASAIAAAEKANVAGPISVKVASGDTLEIEFQSSEEKKFTRLRMTGPAKHVFDGEMDI